MAASAAAGAAAAGIVRIRAAMSGADVERFLAGSGDRRQAARAAAAAAEGTRDLLVFPAREGVLHNPQT